MEEEIEKFIKEHDANVTILHLYEEFDYISRKNIEISVGRLLKDRVIVTSGVAIKFQNKHYPMFKIVKKKK